MIKYLIIQLLVVACVFGGLHLILSKMRRDRKASISNIDPPDGLQDYKFQYRNIKEE